MIDRRAFLRRTASAALAGGAGFGLLSAIGCSSASIAPVPQPSGGIPWDALAKQLKGRLVRLGDAGFARFAQPNNLRYASVLPSGIALCTNANDVSASIVWARENGMPLVARSGGHSYAGYSTTNGLMIDLAQMTDFAFDASSGITTFGGGARNADIFAQCRKAGVAITHGRCLSVGVAGLTLGGGAGFNMRAHGLTCDQLIGTQLVTADGRSQALGARADDDLFWACRGAGGGNFGINTSFQFQTFPVGRLTAYDLRWEASQESVFAALMKALESAPTTLGCKVTASVAAGGHGNDGTVEVQLLGQLYGTPNELLEILQPVYSIAAPTRIAFLDELPYWDAQDKLSEPGDPEYFQERSRFFDDPIGSDVVATVFEWLRRWPATASGASFKVFETGGRMNDVAPNATAFVHRASRWLSSIGLVWNALTSPADLQSNLEWQSRFYAAIVPSAGGGAFQNFIDPSLTDWKSAYYGDNLPRLRAIKDRVDPARVFTFPEAIP